MRLLVTDRKIYWLAFVLVVLLHLLFLSQVGNFPKVRRPTPIEMQTVDVKTLEKIRQEWRQKERALLLNRDPSLPKEKEAPKDARYDSDRNTHVEKEQRARVTQIIPKAGQANPTQTNLTPHPTSKPPSKPKLANLGVRGLTPKPPEEVLEQPPAMAPGGDQALHDPTLPEGSENLLNTQESVFYAFYARVYESVGPLWQSIIRSVPYRRRVAEGEYSTTVEVVFSPEGDIVKVIHHRDSGIAEFDQAVDEAWKKLDHFPNPPKGLIKEDGFGHTGWTFTVNVGSGFNVESLPPERQY